MRQRQRQVNRPTPGDALLLWPQNGIIYRLATTEDTQPSVFVGIDLGGARGKTTAVAVLRDAGDEAEILGLHSRYSGERLVDETLVSLLTTLRPKPDVIAIDAPLTETACNRCVLTQCPGKSDCVDPTVRWLQDTGETIAIDAKNSSDAVWGRTARHGLEPYYHRASEVLAHYRHDALPHGRMGNANGPIAARARHLCRQLATNGYTRGRDIIEVSPRATVSLLIDKSAAQAYRRDADPWVTRAKIISALSLSFAPSSGLSRERVLQSDDCFDAVLCAYTAWLRQTEGWQIPPSLLEVAASDGWIWTPADRASEDVRTSEPDAVETPLADTKTETR